MDLVDDAMSSTSIVVTNKRTGKRRFVGRAGGFLAVKRLATPASHGSSAVAPITAEELLKRLRTEILQQVDIMLVESNKRLFNRLAEIDTSMRAKMQETLQRAILEGFGRIVAGNGQYMDTESAEIVARAKENPHSDVVAATCLVGKNERTGMPGVVGGTAAGFVSDTPFATTTSHKSVTSKAYFQAATSERILIELRTQITQELKTIVDTSYEWLFNRLVERETAMLAYIHEAVQRSMAEPSIYFDLRNILLSKAPSILDDKMLNIRKD